MEKIAVNQTDQSISHPRLFYLQPIDNKRVEVSFTASDISSDGGLLLVRKLRVKLASLNQLFPASMTHVIRVILITPWKKSRHNVFIKSLQDMKMPTIESNYVMIQF